MKSTVKIDYISSGGGITPIIKIIRPQEVVDLQKFPDGDYDVKDKLINDFLQSPQKVEPHGLFEVMTCGPLAEADFHVTTISPLKIEDQFYRFKHNILNRLVPYNTLLSINRDEIDIEVKEWENHQDIIRYKKITEFFTWLDKQEWASYEEQHPYLNEKTKG